MPPEKLHAFSEAVFGVSGLFFIAWLALKSWLEFRAWRETGVSRRAAHLPPTAIDLDAQEGE